MPVQLAEAEANPCGDLANKGLEASLVSIRERFGKLTCPFYPVPGNHDCDVTDDTSLYERVFPERLNYVVKEAGWQLISGYDPGKGLAGDPDFRKDPFLAG
ncbi:MAG: metallophosphoesterase family protein [Oceanipulchritudo sp.]